MGTCQDGVKAMRSGELAGGPNFYSSILIMGVRSE